MNLRGRITFFVTLCILILIGGMQGASVWRETAAESRYADALVNGVRNTWSGLIEIGLRRLDDLAPALARQPAVVRAVDGSDNAALKAAITQGLISLAGTKAPPSVEVVGIDGRLRFSSEGSRTADILGPAVLNRLTTVKQGDGALRGIAVAASGEGIMTLVEPIASNGRLIGAIAVFTSVNTLLTDLSRAMGTPVFLTRTADGHPVGTSDAELWADLAGIRLPEAAVAPVKLKGRVFEVVHFAVADVLQGTALAVQSVRDVTAASRRDFIIRATSQGMMFGVITLFLAFLYWYMRSSFRPLNAVIRLLNALSRGNTEVRLPFTPGGDEIGRLAGTVENFRKGQEAQGRLTTLEQELDLARNIQASFLSTDFPEMENLEVFATMLPAKEVGGDFYDFFPLPDGRFAVVIADVSGKGVGAAMFMAVARTVIRSTAQVVPDPGACIARANDLLSLENAANMFVTLFYGALDPATGRFSYCNAGHNPPVLVGSAGAVEFLPISGDTALGVMDGLDYSTQELTMTAGSSLVLYTDGVTEAFNPNDELFGEHRLTATLSATGAMRAGDCVEALVGNVTAFANGAPQSDDITCLTLRFHPEATAGAVAGAGSDTDTEHRAVSDLIGEALPA